MISTNLLKEHPRNKEFFDDIQGQAWQDFLESIRTSGIITPLVVTRNEDETYTVISGSQRLRAAKELGIEEVPCEVRTYKDRDGITREDWILKDLIETNLRQRGKGNLNDLKLAKCLVELMRIYGIRRGGDRKSALVNSSYQTDKMSELPPNPSQTYLAELIGISERQLRRITKLNDLIPELQQLIDEGKLSTAEGVQLAALDEEVQRKLYYALGEDINKMTAQQIKRIKEESEESIKQLVDEINNLRRELQSREYTLKLKEEEISKKENLIKQYEAAIELSSEKIKRLENGTVKEVIPDSIKKELEALKKERAEAFEKLNLLQQELEKTKKEYEELKQQATADERTRKIIDEINRLNNRISTFKEITSCSSDVKEQFKNSILSLKKSLENMLGSF